MNKIALLNMPLITLGHSALGLMKLKSVLERRFKNRISVDIVYLNHEFGHYIGLESYNGIAYDITDISKTSGFGEWFFRQSAFPQAPDNTKDYLCHFHTDSDKQAQIIKHIIRDKRPQLDNFLDNLIIKYELDKVAIVGFTSISFQNVASFAMAKRLKNRNPNIITIMGGPNCEFPMGDVIAKNIEQIDYVFSGPALKSLPEFVQYCLNDEMDKCHKIDGVFSKKNKVYSASHGEKPSNAECSYEVPCVGKYGEDLDINKRVEFDYKEFLDVFEKSFPKEEVRPVILFETSRGCWWGERHSHCTFCGINGYNMHYTEMSPEVAIRQFRSLFKHSGRCQDYQSVDNIVSKKYFKDVFPYINTPPNVTIFYEVRPNLSKEEVAVLSNAGIRFIQPGIDALATSTLKLMNKGSSVFKNLQFLKHCLFYDILPVWGILIGSPGESEDVYKKYFTDLYLLSHLPPPPMGVVRIAFPRHSPYFNQAKEYNLDLQPLAFYKLVYPFDEDKIANLAYWFRDCNSNAEYAIAREKWIGRLQKKAEIWRKRWWGRTQISEDNNNVRWSPPKLIFKQKGNSTVIYDSRSGQANEHRIDELNLKILDIFERPSRITDVKGALDHISGQQIEKRIAFLQSIGVLFQEGDRFMNLVVRDRIKPKKDKRKVTSKDRQKMTTMEFMSFLLANDVTLWVDKENLYYNARPGIMTAELCKDLKSRKAEIIALLQEADA